jgi:hypothetical protein
MLRRICGTAAPSSELPLPRMTLGKCLILRPPLLSAGLDNGSSSAELATHCPRNGGSVGHIRCGAGRAKQLPSARPDCIRVL